MKRIERIGFLTLALALVAAGVATPSTARAFCGFFVAGSNARLTNHASQVVLLRSGNHTVMTMSNTYQGPPENFAMVVPVPVVLQKEDVKTLDPAVFDHIDALSAPRLVEYWEQDPCYREREEKDYARKPMASSGPRERSAKKESAADLGVTIEAKFAVGEYEILILSAKDSGGLDTWLRQEKYTIPQGAAEALAPYVRDQMKFFVAKVNIDKVKRNEQGMVVLSPLRFAFTANELRLPVRLGLLNASGEGGAKQDLLVYLLHPRSRFEVANYQNVFIPTNLEVADEVRRAFPGFYAELFDQTLARSGGKAVVTEYAWQTTSCDPCPTPPLQASDLATLGLDVINGLQQQQQPQPPQPQPNWRGPGRRWMGGAPSWVLTRLHARYDRASLSEDLLFREAKPVMGGRSNWDGTSADAGGQVHDAGVNNFQGRYIIRHYWTGPVHCPSPNYNKWGGPPGGSHYAGPTSAKGLALAPRGKVVLKSVVRSPVPLLELQGQPPPRRSR